MNSIISFLEYEDDKTMDISEINVHMFEQQKFARKVSYFTRFSELTAIELIKKIIFVNFAHVVIRSTSPTFCKPFTVSGRYSKKKSLFIS